MNAMLILAVASVAFGPIRTPTAAAADLARGQYLVESLGACDNCHTRRGPNGYDFSTRFSGGSQTFTDKSYTVRGSNISPDRQTGVGEWSDAALGAAITRGKGLDGPLAPAMPSDSYRALTKSDLEAIIGYLRAATPVQTPQPAQQRSGPWSPHPLPGAETAFDEAALADTSKRGLYVVSIARCMACHSGEADDAPDHVNKLGAGGKIFRTPAGVAVASNITAHPEKGIGAWSDEDLKRAIMEGVSRDGRALKPPMSTLAKAHFSKMSAEDLGALIAWLRTIPAKE